MIGKRQHINMSRRNVNLVSSERKVFIVDMRHPWREPTEQYAVIVTKPKTVWAVLKNGKHYMFGATAFVTLISAQRARHGRLALMHKSKGLKIKFPDIWKCVDVALKTQYQQLH